MQSTEEPLIQRQSEKVWLNGEKETEGDQDYGLEFPEGRAADIQDSYKNLGYPQTNGNHYEDARRSAKT